MLARLTAAWLVFLIAAPFTAPFSTCDLASMFYGTAAGPASALSATSPVTPPQGEKPRIAPGIRIRSRSREREDQGNPGTSPSVCGESAVPGSSMVRAGARNRLWMRLLLASACGGRLAAPSHRRVRALDSSSSHNPPGGAITILRL